MGLNIVAVLVAIFLIVIYGWLWFG
ncbi:hypothetical protein vBBak6_049 [Bacillus phage v_B-Bak6]|uniref:Uncharacterized protein n=1 Tax=Bacillus phage Basilisk TaxID=1296654 RepID=S5M431_9CAUD|nr:hypothetical protein PP653_gp110 [Bacillus phage Basilisk]AGR46601.1 hypothetical protein BASILISK_57 [Bacillus phage Basilisk]AXY83009.1 hypothetical protein vBBak1_049 [Bacillus phage v_B-Bak1]AXY83129.1 hypothetical protein vBBak6_049 [Bacillus phage v_B-Bak6]